MKELGIYIHIPFCKSKCEYCDFISFDNKKESVKNYINKLKQEMILFFNNITKNDYYISTIYIGGGTPSYIESFYITELLEILKENFDISKSEITIEVNPGTVNEKKLKDYYNSGINRISIGLQSTNNKLLKLIGRIHTYEEFLDTYKIAENVGFKNINVDLMLGLPTQTIHDIEKSLKQLIDLNPKHISVYSLILEKETKLEKKIKNKELILPNDEVERKMYWKIREILEKNKYNQYEISNFSKRGYESLHNLNCWKQKEYIGFGLAAHSYLNLKRFSNTEKIEKYLNGNFEKTIHEIQTRETQMNEYIILGLRKIKGINLLEFKQKFLEDILLIYGKKLERLEAQKLIQINRNNIKLTPKGIDFANIVWSEFV